MADVNLVEAVNLALAFELEHDPSVVLLGEDIGVNGGVFRATVGLQARFGAQRVIDSPLAEAALAGTAIGMAAVGLKPVVEIQFSGFIYPAIDHVLNHAARLRHRTRGRLSCPMVIRSPCGGGIHAPEHHSESPEALFTHIPGLRVVVPSSPARAYGLLLAAIRDPDPVIFFEPTRLYRVFRQPVDDTGEALPTPALAEQYAVLVEHYHRMLDHYGRDTGMKMARKHLGWYTKGLHGSAEFRNFANFIDDPNQVLGEIERFYAPVLLQQAA